MIRAGIITIVITILQLLSIFGRGAIVVYRDELASGWANNSWQLTVNTRDNSARHFGLYSIKADNFASFASLYLNVVDGIPLSNTNSNGEDVIALSFWWRALPGSNATAAVVQLINTTGTTVPGELKILVVGNATPPENDWQRVYLQLSAPVPIKWVGALHIRFCEGTCYSGTVYVDDITLVSSSDNLQCGNGIIDNGEQCDFNVASCNQDTCCLSWIATVQGQSVCPIGGNPSQHKLFMDSLLPDWSMTSSSQANISSANPHYGSSAILWSASPSSVLRFVAPGWLLTKWDVISLWIKGNGQRIILNAKSPNNVTSTLSIILQEQWSRVVVPLAIKQSLVESFDLTAAEDVQIGDVFIDDVSLYASEAASTCGNGIIEPGEQCDFSGECNTITCCFFGYERKVGNESYCSLIASIQASSDSSSYSNIPVIDDSSDAKSIGSIGSFSSSDSQAYSSKSKDDYGKSVLSSDDEKVKNNKSGLDSNSISSTIDTRSSDENVSNESQNISSSSSARGLFITPFLLYCNILILSILLF